MDNKQSNSNKVRSFFDQLKTSFKSSNKTVMNYSKESVHDIFQKRTSTS